MQTLKAVCKDCLGGFEKPPEVSTQRGSHATVCAVCGKTRFSIAEVEYYKVYWEQNRSEVLGKRKSRYDSDPAYRQGIIDRAKRRYWESRSKQPVHEKQAPKSVMNVKFTHRARVILQGDKEVTVYKTAELARRCKITPQTVRAWEGRGVIPPATMIDEKKRRWYSESYMNLLSGLVTLHWNSLKGLNDFAKLVKAEFEKA